MRAELSEGAQSRHCGDGLTAVSSREAGITTASRHTTRGIGDARSLWLSGVIVDTPDRANDFLKK